MTSPGNPRGTRLSPDWQPTTDLWNFAAEQGFTATEIERIVDEFRDFWCDVPGYRGLKINWRGTFKNRVRQLAERRGFKPSISQPRRQSIIDVAETLDLGLRAR